MNDGVLPQADDPAPASTRPKSGKAIRRRSLHEEVTERIRDMIVEGELPAGTRISEKELCAAFDISRTPLRESLKVLAAEGLLELLPNRGAVVSRLSVEEVGNVLEVMAALEVTAAERACRMITDAQLAALEHLHDRMVGHFRRDELMDYFKTNQQIHEAIIVAAGNPILLKTYLGLSGRIRRIRYIGHVRAARWQQAVAEHEAILDALKQRDAERLTGLMRDHLTAGWEVVRELIRDELSEEAGTPARAGAPAGTRE